MLSTQAAIQPGRYRSRSTQTAAWSEAAWTDAVLKKSLRTLAVNADGRIEAFRESIEQWYDDHMDRVSGWYKRHVRQFSIGIGILLILAFNVNAVSITGALYTDQALRESVVTQAVSKKGHARHR